LHGCRIELTKQDTLGAFEGQQLGILTPGHLPNLPATALTLQNNETAQLQFFDLGILTHSAEEEQLLRSYHDLLTSR